MRILCPCGRHEIEEEELLAKAAPLLGKKGGQLSKRVITPEQQASMQAGRKRRWDKNKQGVTEQ